MCHSTLKIKTRWQLEDILKLVWKTMGLIISLVSSKKECVRFIRMMVYTIKIVEINFSEYTAIYPIFTPI